MSAGLDKEASNSADDPIYVYHLRREGVQVKTPE
jgi:hypothetical protein